MLRILCSPVGRIKSFVALMSLEQLLLYVAQELDLPNLRINSNGVCQFTVDDRVTVCIEDAPLERCVHFYSTVAQVPDTGREPLFAALLEAQLFGREIAHGAAFGFEPSAGEILLCRRLHVDAIEPDVFAEALTEFVNWSEHWKSKLAHFGETLIPAPENSIPQHFIRA